MGEQLKLYQVVIYLRMASHIIFTTERAVVTMIMNALKLGESYRGTAKSLILLVKMCQ